MHKLRAFRKKLNKNGKEMALSINVSVSYYYKIEQGFQEPSYGFLRKIKKEYPMINIDLVFFEE